MPGDDHIRANRFFSRRHATEAAPRVRLLHLGVFEASAADWWGRHQHLDYEAIVVVRGSYRCRLNGAEMAVPRGSCLLVKPFDWHDDLVARGTCWWAMRFALVDASVRTAAGWFRDGIAAEGQRCVAPREAVALLERMRVEAGRADALSVLLQDALAAEFAWRLAGAFPSDALAPGLVAADAAGSFEARLERWFETRLRGTLSVPEMARAMGLGRTALNAACRRHLGVSPAKAFSRFKLDRAHDLLARTGMNVVEVADHLGYANPFHFSRAFKRRFGLPPSRAGKR